MQQPPTFTHLLFENQDKGVWLATINRPDKLNALNPDVFKDLGELGAFLESKEHSIRCVVLTGAGAKAFAAGADIGPMAEMNSKLAEAFSRKAQEHLRTLEYCGVPVIAAVNGFAFGGGNEVAMACTLRYAADTAKFGQPEVKLGIIPGAGGHDRLIRLVGPGKARELILRPEIFWTAEQALAFGLVNGVFPAADLLTKVIEIAHEIATRPHLAITAAIDVMNEGQGGSPCEVMENEARRFGDLFNTVDAHEGLSAFLEKRQPKFTNR